MIKQFVLAAVLLSSLQLTAEVTEYKGKSIYLPKELRANDFTDPASKWSYDRMACTDNIVLFWAPGFGGNIAAAPDLEGHDMKVDLANLLDRLESF